MSHTGQPAQGPGKTLRLLVRPGLTTLDASVWDVTAEALGLLLSQPLTPGTVVAVLNRVASLTESRILSGRVVSATPWAGGGWLVNCRLSCRLTDRELRGFLS